MEFSGRYGDWSKWGACSSSCRQQRSRPCVLSSECEGSVLHEQRRCQRTSSGRCQPQRRGRWGIGRRLEDLMYDLLYEDWSTWSVCTRSCKRRRYRTCSLQRWCRNTVLLEEKGCTDGPCRRRKKEEDDVTSSEQNAHKSGRCWLSTCRLTFNE